jgi:hypothetical protein
MTQSRIGRGLQSGSPQMGKIVRTTGLSAFAITFLSMSQFRFLLEPGWPGRQAPRERGEDQCQVVVITAQRVVARLGLT